MFDTVITTTPLTSVDANAYFEPRISGGEWCGDYTMLAVLRALLDKRLGENESFSAAVYSTSSNIANSEDALRRGLRNYSNLELSSSLTICDISGDKDRVASNIEALTTLFPQAFSADNWTELRKIKEYFRRNFPVVCFVDEVHKRAVLFAANMTYNRLHLITMCIPGLLGWYFAENKPTRQEVGLLCALDKPNSTEFLSILQEIADAYDFRANFIRSQLAGLETRALRGKKTDLEGKIANYRDQIRQYNESISRVLESIWSGEIELAGVTQKLAESSGAGEDSEIMRFFMENKNIKLISCEDDRLKFVCTGILYDWDEDRADGYIRNDYGSLYSYTQELKTEQIKRLMTAIFLDRTLKLHVAAAYEFRFPSRVTALSDSSDVRAVKDCYPNPHIQRHGCMDGFTSIVNQYLQRHNYIGAIEACMASACSMNWRDGTVMSTFASTFLRNVSGWNRKAIELPTGEIVDPKGAVAWLEAQDEKKETEE